MDAGEYGIGKNIEIRIIQTVRFIKKENDLFEFFALMCWPG